MSGYVRGASRVKIWMAIAVMMFAAVGHAGKAEAGFYSGSQLLERCESDSGARLTCVGFLAGIDDITDDYDAWGLMDPNFCIPAGVSLSQLRKVAIRGLNEQPEKLHLAASSLVHNIFVRAFPCD